MNQSRTNSKPAPGVDPETLPQIKADPYADVDVNDFSTAGEMSRGQILTMVSIAQHRGNVEAARQWRMVGVHDAQAEAQAEDVARMNKMLNPEPYVPHVGPLVEPKAVEPWAEDRAFKAAAAKVARAQTKADKATDGTPGRVEANSAVQRAQVELSDVTDGLKEVTGWSESEQRAADAQASLRGKADAVARMMGIPT